MEAGGDILAQQQDSDLRAFKLRAVSSTVGDAPTRSLPDYDPRQKIMEGLARRRAYLWSLPPDSDEEDDVMASAPAEVLECGELLAQCCSCPSPSGLKLAQQHPEDLRALRPVSSTIGASDAPSRPDYDPREEIMKGMALARRRAYLLSLPPDSDEEDEVPAAPAASEVLEFGSAASVQLEVVQQSGIVIRN